MARILLVEDNNRFGQLLKEHLGDAGYATDLVADARTFEDMAALYEYALYIVDLALPDGDGLDLIVDLRAQGCVTPILVATARAQTDDRVAGLDCGADDYLIKPFHHSELFARVRALLRRPRKAPQTSVIAGKLTLDIETGEVICGGRRLVLRRSEQRLLSLLIERPGRIVMRDTIENMLHGEFETSPNAIEQAVCRLRKALSEWPVGFAIRTIRGSGYKLEAADVIET